ncbi:Gfo/Idh/MocA family protein [Tundrisphaera lichenicola]|uniref:Gfo/Idh/MocA family protein n=1 Tax=Tundrisphaera lichenicola TaxID=2029860 RepID=UPI003EBBEE8D
MAHQSRRRFLGQSLAAAAGVGFAISGTKSSGRIIGANDAIRVGVAGLNGRGSSHVGAYSKMKNVEITYLIDPDSRTFDKHLKTIKSAGGSDPRTIKDVREALDDKNLDAISIATPNHWHALMTVWGCQAGKDVYVEKPCSHNVHEGRVAVEAARKYGRIVQHGTQGRSSKRWAEIAELVKSGHYGKLEASRGLCYKPRWQKPLGDIGFKPDSTPPAELDFNLWTGPATEHAFNANYVHYNWHWFWDFGNGDVGNQGVHQMDIARWMIPGAALPKSVQSVGGRFGYKDQGETPNTLVTAFDYGDTQLIFEVRGLKADAYLGEKVGNILHLEAGTIAGGKFFPKGSDKAEALAKVDSLDREPEGDHFSNFIAAVRSRKVDDLNADIQEGHYSSALCHLANISYRTGEPVEFASQTQPFAEGCLGGEAFARMKDHLATENGLQLSGESYRLGRKLDFDPKVENFVGTPEANALLTRSYRKPFVVPAGIA